MYQLLYAAEIYSCYGFVIIKDVCQRITSLLLRIIQSLIPLLLLLLLYYTILLPLLLAASNYTAGRIICFNFFRYNNGLCVFKVVYKELTIFLAV